MSYILGRRPKQEAQLDGDPKTVAQTKATRSFFLVIFQSNLEKEACAEAKAEPKTKDETKAKNKIRSQKLSEQRKEF